MSGFITTYYKKVALVLAFSAGMLLTYSTVDINITDPAIWLLVDILIIVATAAAWIIFRDRHSGGAAALAAVATVVTVVFTVFGSKWSPLLSSKVESVWYIYDPIMVVALIVLSFKVICWQGTDANK